MGIAPDFFSMRCFVDIHMVHVKRTSSVIKQSGTKCFKKVYFVPFHPMLTLLVRFDILYNWFKRVSFLT